MVLETARRLCLLFEAGKVRFSVEATSVVEVSNPDPDGETLRGLLALFDLSRHLGGPEEQRPGMAVVLDVSPTLALRVGRVLGVHDLAQAPLLNLPRGLGGSLLAIVRGALLHQSTLYLELLPDELRKAAQDPDLSRASIVRPVRFLAQPAEPALVFQSRGQRFGLALGYVSQVVNAGDAYCALPAAEGGTAGLYPHAQALWPIFSAAALQNGGGVEHESLLVLTELAGENVGFCAEKVLGVHSGFVPTDVPGAFACATLAGPCTFLDLHQMFSPHP